MGLLVETDEIGVGAGTNFLKGEVRAQIWYSARAKRYGDPASLQRLPTAIAWVSKGRPC
jgi:hypothetical protein